LLLDDVPLPAYASGRNHVDFRNADAAAHDRLVHLVALGG
jgi:hypothetical protein